MKRPRTMQDVYDHLRDSPAPDYVKTAMIEAIEAMVSGEEKTRKIDIVHASMIADCVERINRLNERILELERAQEGGGMH